MLLAHDVTGPTDGREVVLVHGITDSRRMWDPLLGELTDRYRVLSVDLRGHGESADASDYDPQSYAGDVVETMHAVGMGRPVMIGHSLGGLVVTGVAGQATVAGAVNIDQPLRLAAFKQALSALEPMLRSDEATFQEAMQMMFTAMNGPLPAAEQARIDAQSRASQPVVLATWAPVFDLDEAELDGIAAGFAQAVTVPYLALHGSDPGPDYAGWLGAQIPTSLLEVWTDHGHFPHLVDPDRFLARVHEFVAGCP